MATDALDLPARLRTMRILMKERDLQAYIVPSEDAHGSEYLAPRDARRAYISGFTGSAGCAVITMDAAYCWTDGRYWLQAGRQLGPGWTLMKQGLPDVPTWATWIKTELPRGSRIGIDPALISYSEAATIRPSITPSSLVAVDDNLVDLVWDQGQLHAPCTEIFHLEDRYTGENVASKLARMREILAKSGSPALIVTQLDEVAWLLNLRASDIPYNPVFFSYVILTREDCTLFAFPPAITEPIRQYLHAYNIAILNYDQTMTSLISLRNRVTADRAAKPYDARGATVAVQGMKVPKTDKVFCSSKASLAVVNAIGEDNVEIRRSVIEEAKAKKNATEVEGFRQSHIRDGAALCRYFAWLQDVLNKGERWTEYDAAEVLSKFRQQCDFFKGESFETISSTGANAAIIHYAPPKEGSAVIDRNKVYLCDSGAQFLDGTTDTTRTWHFGTPTQEEKRAFTRVLQGNIALDTIVFPQGTTGYVLDILARRPLWSDGLDYRHSTSHGIGSFLNVHEGPQGVGQRPQYNEVSLQSGMVISNEPGYYADGKFGIRIENVDVVKTAQTRENFGGKEFLELEVVTMVPIQTKLIDLSLMSDVEVKWLNEYHAEVLRKVGPILQYTFKDLLALQWLEEECRPVQAIARS